MSSTRYASTEVVLGVDVGTTATKSLVVGTDGSEIAVAQVPTRWVEDGPRVQASAQGLVAGVLTVVGDALEAAGRRLGTGVQAVALGVTGMAEAGVLIGPDGSVRAPVVAWFDTRGAEALAGLPTELREAFPGTTGLPLTSLCTFAKLLWLRGEGIEAGAGHCWLSVPEYVVLALGGERAAEPSLASRTGLIDQGTGGPWAEALAAVGATVDLLPPLRAAGTVLGHARGPGVPTALAGAALVVAGHDHPVASFGAGAWGDDDLFDSCGTAEAVLRVVAAPPEHQQRAALVGAGLTVGAHVLEDRWVLAGPTRGGLVLKRVLAMLGRTDEEGRDALDRSWDPSRARAGVRVRGALMTDDDVRVLLDGDSAGPDEVWAAALEHVNGAVRAIVETVDDQVGRRGAVVAAGGWTAMRSVRGAKLRTLPDTTFAPGQQLGCFGAATLAAWGGSGRYGAAADFALGFTPAPGTPADGTTTDRTARARPAPGADPDHRPSHRIDEPQGART